MTAVLSQFCPADGAVMARHTAVVADGSSLWSGYRCATCGSGWAMGYVGPVGGRRERVVIVRDALQGTDTVQVDGGKGGTRLLGTWP